MAAGSQLCSGMTAAFTPTPKTSSAKSPQSCGSLPASEERMPPARKVTSTPSRWAHAVAPMSASPLERV